MQPSISLGIILFHISCLCWSQSQIINDGDLQAANAHFESGQDHLFSDQYQAAIREFKKAISLNDGNADYWYAMSNAFTLNDVLDSAQWAIKQAISLAPDQADFYVQSGHILFRQGKYEDSSTQYEKALQHAETGEVPINKGHVYFNRGVCFLKLESYNMAALEFKFAERAGNEEAQLYHNRGIAYLRAGKNVEACADFTKAKELGSTISSGYIKNCDEPTMPESDAG